jgi:hypothetical protein
MKKQLFSACMVMAVCGFAETPFPRWSPAYAVTQGPKEHLFASYYAMNAWSPDQRSILVLETDVREGLPTENDVATIGLVDLEKNNAFIPLTTTRCWNFQEATMAHWLGKENQFIYNDWVDGRFVSIVFDVATRTKRTLPHPIAAVTPDGEWAISINYARLRLTRPDYGYGGKGQDAQENVVFPENDGLWLMHVKSGETKLLVSIASQREKMAPVQDPKALAYFCHVVFSRDGQKIFWLARSVENLAAQSRRVTTWQTTAFVCTRDGREIVRCFPDGWGGSHFNWKDGASMCVTANWEKKTWSHVLFTPGKADWRRLGCGLLDFDGHCVFANNGLWLASDTYPDKLNERKLFLVRLADDAILPLGTYAVPDLYKNQYSRCDLHPRFRKDDRMIGFNSVHEGTRQVYLMKLQ